ncbi:uncharacterized protein LOC119979830 [Tripterygium wilfordii]|uniref:uncharacterized protein LOC119979830 n=1 Tax=Tripterygium wilfordii TaxID=458696 RepID=UPI0018F832F0|nr:uncharacterized protein LOC119979830 [Tripterygium wilfordii]
MEALLDKHKNKEISKPLIPTGSFNLSFPLDLRSILREGLPVGHHFPSWRFSSEQQLRILIDLPRLNLLRNISTNSFWVDFWGDKLESIEQAVKKAKLFIDKAHLLVPVYRNCYIPSTPNVAGNPVFYIDDREVHVISYEVNSGLRWLSTIVEWWRMGRRTGGGFVEDFVGE